MKRPTKRTLLIVGGVVLAGAGITACGSAQANTIHNDVTSSANALQQLQTAQPTPQYKWSQLRETLIDIENAQADTTQTTTFFFNQGVQTPIGSCPSIGFPLASTTEITNPTQDDNGATIGEVDPTGVYAGDSTGTYVVCVSPNGSNYIQYWEGFVDSVSGPAVWDAQTDAVRLTGPSTVTVKSRG